MNAEYLGILLAVLFVCFTAGRFFPLRIVTRKIESRGALADRKSRATQYMQHRWLCVDWHIAKGTGPFLGFDVPTILLESQVSGERLLFNYCKDDIQNGTLVSLRMGSGENPDVWIESFGDTLIPVPIPGWLPK